MSRKFLTLFSCPKPFVNPHIVTIQRNAIQSWTRLGADVEILLLGDETGVAETAADYGVRYIPGVACSKMGTPLIDSLFDLSRRNSDSPLLAYVNADILLLPDLVSAARSIAQTAQKFLMVGQRWDLDVRASLDFSPGWEAILRERVRQEARLHSFLGIDCFVFPRACFTDIPPFVIGRAGWDNWMIYKAHLEKWPVIDMTASVTVIHQEHDYSHLQGQTLYGHPETEENIRLAGGKINTHYSLLDADRRLVRGRIRPVKWKLLRLMRLAERILLRINHPPRRFFNVLHDYIYLRRVKLQERG